MALVLIHNYMRPYFSEYYDTENPPADFEPIQLSIRRVRLNAGGYDRHGEYFGTGAPLYAIDGEATNGNEIHTRMRSNSDRAEICDRLRAKYGKLVKFRK